MSEYKAQAVSEPQSYSASYFGRDLDGFLSVEGVELVDELEIVIVHIFKQQRIAKQASQEACGKGGVKGNRSGVNLAVAGFDRSRDDCLAGFKQRSVKRRSSLSKSSTFFSLRVSLKIEPVGSRANRPESSRSC